MTNTKCSNDFSRSTVFSGWSQANAKGASPTVPGASSVQSGLGEIIRIAFVMMVCRAQDLAHALVFLDRPSSSSLQRRFLCLLS